MTSLPSPNGNPQFDACPSPWMECLKALVEQTISDNGYPFDGQMWAAEPQSWWREQLGVSEASLRRAVAKPPFVRNWARVKGRKMMLLRVGEKGPPTPRDIAIYLRKIWQKKTGTKETPASFGCLVGLAERWGEDAPRILTMVLNEWGKFMCGVKLEETWTVNRYFKYPCITLIRRFPQVAEEMDMMIQQENWVG